MDPPSGDQQNAPKMPSLSLSLDQLRSAGKADQGSGSGDAGIAAVAVAKAAAFATQVEKVPALAPSTSEPMVTTSASLTEEQSKRKRSLELEQQKKALNSFLGEGNSVTERMALAGADDQAGLAMQKTIFKQFQVGEQRAVAWFKADGSRQVFRHPVNARKVGTRVTKYAARIKETGILQGVRGEPWVVYDPSKEIYLCISYGTLSEAFYLAHSESPDAVGVKSTLQQGLQGCRVIDHRCPHEVLVYLRDLHNDFHGGLAVTYHDAVSGVEEVEKAWKGYCEFKGLTFRNCQYQKMQCEYIRENWSHKYKTGQTFDLCRRLARDLRDLHGFDLWDGFFGKYAEFPEGESLLTVVQNMQSFTHQLCMNFLSSYPPELLAIIALEGCKFMAEIAVAGDEGRHLPEVEILFAKHVPSMFERLKVPVSGAGWVEKIFKAKGREKKTKEDEEGDTSKTKSSAKAKAKAKGKAKAKVKAKAAASNGTGDQEDRDEVVADVQMDVAGRRQKWWLDDLIACLLRASGRTLPMILEDDSVRKVFSTCISYGLEFAFHKKVLLKGKTFKLWSQVRPQLQTLMTSVNRVLPEGCAEDMVQSLLNQIRTSKTDGDAARPSAAVFSCIPRNLPTAAAQSDNACEIVKQFILANNSENIKMHPAFSRFIFLMKAAICTCPNNMSTCPSHAATSEPITLEDLFFFMSTALSDCVGAMVPTVALGANMVSDLIQSCEKQSAPAFPETIAFLLTTKEELDDDGLKVSRKVLNEDLTQLLLGIRVLYMVEGFKALMRLLSTGNASEDDAKILTSLGLKISELSSYLDVIQHTVTSNGIAETNQALQDCALKCGIDPGSLGQFALLIEGALCMNGTDAGDWAVAWTQVIKHMKAHKKMPLVGDIFSSADDTETKGTGKEENNPESKVKQEVLSPGASATRNVRNAMQSMQMLGVVNEDEDRVQMSAILSLSNLGGKSMGMQSINVVDILALQRHLEIELMKKAMSYNDTLSKLWIDYGKSNILADVTQLQPDTDRVYVYGSVTCDASARNVQVATLELEDGTCISFYVNPVGFDKLTSTAPCCAWIIKPVQGRKGQDQGTMADGDDGEWDSDDEAKDDGCFMSIKYDEYDLTAESIASLTSAVGFDAIDPPCDGPSDRKTDLFGPADLHDGRHVEASGHVQPQPMDVSNDGNGSAAQSEGNLQTATAHPDEVSKGDGKTTAKLSGNEKDETVQGKGDHALQAAKAEESGQIGTSETAENKAKQAPTEIMDKSAAMEADDEKPNLGKDLRKPSAGSLFRKDIDKSEVEKFVMHCKVPYLTIKAADELPKKFRKAMQAAKKKRKTNPKDNIAILTRPPFLSKKDVKRLTLAAPEPAALGGKAFDKLLKRDDGEKDASAKKTSGLLDSSVVGKDAAHLLN